MVKTWSEKDSADDICEKCGSVYSVKTERFPVRDKDAFICVVCGHTMHEWNSTHVPIFTLKRRGTD